MTGLNAFKEGKEGDTCSKVDYVIQMVKALVFLHGFFLFQNKKDSQATVEKWSSGGPEQLILVVHMVIGALESVSLSHTWGLRLKVAFSVLRFSIHLCY